MPAEPHALSTVQPPEPPADGDYDAICAAVTATARGRWFLEEYAKRNRNADTSQVLAAIARMEATVVGERAQQASRAADQEVRIELLDMARTIAQARAEVAESRPVSMPSQASTPTGTAPAPDVATAAERLRQIAWTIRACGIELPAAEQIGEIANTILSADALRGLGEQQARKLTETLHYLEHRIERMLDGHCAAAGDATHSEPATDALQASDRTHDAAPVTLAVAMIAAALRPGSTVADATPEAAPAPAQAEATATSMAQGALAASDVAEYPMDDDVVLTVADSAIEPPTDAIPMRAERVELELEPLTPAKPPTREAVEPEFTGLELEPLAVVAPVAAVPATKAPPAVEDTPVAAVLVAETPPPAEATPVAAVLTVEAPPALDAAPDVPAAGDVEEPLAPPAAATAEPFAEATAELIAEPTVEPTVEPDAADSGANDNLPMMLAAQAGTTTETDTIAMQVAQDLDGLTDAAPDEAIGAAAALPQPVMQPAMVPAADAQVVTGDDPAQFLLESTPQKAPVSDLVASSQATRAQLSDTLAAIENELFGSTRPDAGMGSQPSTAILATPGKPVTPAVAAGPLAALMAMSEEERIAVFS